MNAPLAVSRRVAAILGGVLTTTGMSLTVYAGPSVANCVVTNELAVVGFAGSLIAFIGGYLVKHAAS